MAVLETLEVGGAFLDSIGINLSGISNWGIFGGKSQSKSCKEAQARVADAFRKYFTTSEMKELSNVLDEYANSNHGANPEGLAFEYIGGKDCKVDNKGKQRWVDYVDRRLEEKIRAERNTAKTYGDKYNTNEGYSESAETTPAAAIAGAASAGVGAIQVWIIPVLVLAFIAFFFNWYQK